MVWPFFFIGWYTDGWYTDELYLYIALQRGTNRAYGYRCGLSFPERI